MARALFDHAGVAAVGVLRAGIERTLPKWHGLRQRDARLGPIDGEIPAIAGGVPVELVEILEEADLPRGDILDHVVVAASVENAVGAADPHAYAIVQVLKCKVFGIAIARDGQHLKAHDDLTAVAPAMIGGREVAKDATADLVSFRLHRDRLGDGEIAIALDGRVADKIENPLDRACGRKRREQNNERNRNARHHDFPPSETVGAAACERSSSSKNGSSRKPNGRASSTPGNCWMPMLRLRTAPL